MSAEVIVDPILLDFSKTCRLCLQQTTELMPLFSENEYSGSPDTSLPSKIMACVSIEVSNESGNIPRQVCCKCIQQIDNWVKFKELCDSANALLHQCLANLQSSDETETLKINLQVPDTLLSDMDVSIFERDSLFGAFEDGSLPSCDDLNVSFSESMLNQKIQFSKKPVIENNNISMTELNSSFMIIDPEKNILSSEIESFTSNEVKEQKKTQDPSKWRQKYNEFYRKHYPCNICKKTFSKFTHLIRHDRAEHSDRLTDFSCSVCGLMFVSRSRVDIHMLKHREKTFECTECNKKMLSKKSLSIHLRLHKPDNKFLCQVCGVVKCSKRMLDDHVRCVHSKETPFRCELCGKEFRTKQSKELHSRRHLNVKMYKCNTCGCLIDNVNSYKFHLETHKSVKDIVCHTCGKLFKSIVTLNEHKLRKHGNSKPFKCVICSSSFPQRYLLVRHETTHFDLRPFICNVCDKSFKRKDLLTAHNRIHTGEKRYSCVNCSDSFFNLQSLKKHKCPKTVNSNTSEDNTKNCTTNNVLTEKHIDENNVTNL
ncbi:uncharacterized protein LOC142327368 [Lycorma delicatula]|uniref:uncharacterized protein LOC142327368 n=1 Tax=Lycorma delicatula TaxID=130591 RepID=UPI003F51A23D